RVARAAGTPYLRASPVKYDGVVGMGRQPPAVPAGSVVPAVPGLEDEDEDEDEDERSTPNHKSQI
ncbi:MAG: hypothetical protein ACOYD3_14025, partial [Kiritimatiellia bacterium]